MLRNGATTESGSARAAQGCGCERDRELVWVGEQTSFGVGATIIPVTFTSGVGARGGDMCSAWNGPDPPGGGANGARPRIGAFALPGPDPTLCADDDDLLIKWLERELNTSGSC